MLLIVAAIALLQATPSVTEISRGTLSGIAEPRTVIIRSPVEWEGLWKAHDPRAAPLPDVNFQARMIAAVFLGSRPTGGYSVEITGARMDGSTMVIEYVERAPAAGAILTQALTAPFHIVTVPAHAGMVRFERRATPGGSPAAR